MRVTREFSAKVARLLNQEPEEQLDRIAEEQIDEGIPLLQVGCSSIRWDDFDPIVPAKGAPLVSDIVVEHRKQGVET